ncbi:MAG: AAA family ATPase [Chitinophagaceae bacterium]
MEFHRSLYTALLDWKTKPNRKPLVLRGARQVGKTTLVKEFAKTYTTTILLNLEKKVDADFFDGTDDVKEIVEWILLSKNIKRKPRTPTLLFIDEIQESPKAIKLLRYFYEEMPELHVISAGSLLEFALKDVESFPVGRIEYLYLYPLNFMEYLKALDNENLYNELQNVPMRKIAHRPLMDQFHRYAIIGGMPEVVKEYLRQNSIAALAPTYESIWTSYTDDVEKYAATPSVKQVIKFVLKTASGFIDQRIKFQNFGNSNYKSREVGEALRDLDKAKIVRLVYPTTSVAPPIVSDFKKSPRLQILDTGIVNYTLGIAHELLASDDLSDSYKGALIPHLVNQELISLQCHKSETPHFWVREKAQSSAEVDVVVPYNNYLIPVEIKSGSTGSLKSLHQYMDTVDHPYAVRIYGGELEIQHTKTPQGKPYILMHLPYYLGTKLYEYLGYLVEGNK